MSKESTLMNDIIEHCNESMQRALAAERFPLWKRACPELSEGGKRFLMIMKTLMILRVLRK